MPSGIEKSVIMPENHLTTLLGLCKLYKGGNQNPYKPFDLQGEEWAKEYIKFQVWDAEYSVCQNYYWWLDTWQRNYSEPGLSKNNIEEAVYKLAINCKLKKISDIECDFIKMYYEL